MMSVNAPMLSNPCCWGCLPHRYVDIHLWMDARLSLWHIYSANDTLIGTCGVWPILVTDDGATLGQYFGSLVCEHDNRGIESRDRQYCWECAKCSSFRWTDEKGNFLEEHAKLEFEFGYDLTPSAWGNGYAKEAIVACLSHLQQPDEGNAADSNEYRESEAQTTDMCNCIQYLLSSQNNKLKEATSLFYRFLWIAWQSPVYYPMSSGCQDWHWQRHFESFDPESRVETEKGSGYWLPSWRKGTHCSMGAHTRLYLSCNVFAWWIQSKIAINKGKRHRTCKFASKKCWFWCCSQQSAVN